MLMNGTEPSGNDVRYCPACGELIQPEQRIFREDLVLNRYRTEFRCSACGYHGDLFRHEPGDPDPDVMTDGGTEQTVEFPDEDVGLVLTPRDIEDMLNGEDAVWTGVLPGIKFTMSAEVVDGSTTESER